MIAEQSLDNFGLPDDASMLSDGDGSFRSDLEEAVSDGSTHSVSKSESGHASTDSNTPEALVKRENRTVNISRVIVILILIGATIATGYFVFRFTREGEEEAYNDAFYNVAGKLTSSMVSDTSLKVRMSAS
jgi:hypothetical protein